MRVDGARFRAVGLVRDSAGRPRLDEILGVPLELWRLLTAEEREEVRRDGGYPSDDRDP